jgi:hypothetical protein
MVIGVTAVISMEINRIDPTHESDFDVEQFSKSLLQFGPDLLMLFLFFLAIYFTQTYSCIAFLSHYTTAAAVQATPPPPS